MLVSKKKMAKVTPGPPPRPTVDVLARALPDTFPNRRLHMRPCSLWFISRPCSPFSAGKVFAIFNAFIKSTWSCGYISADQSQLVDIWVNDTYFSHSKERCRKHPSSHIFENHPHSQIRRASGCWALFQTTRRRADYGPQQSRDMWFY